MEYTSRNIQYDTKKSSRQSGKSTQLLTLISILYSGFILCKIMYKAIHCKRPSVLQAYFFLPLLGLANRAGLIWSLGTPLTENSLAALSWRVPPHFTPSAMSSLFSCSIPSASSSSALPKARRSTGPSTCADKEMHGCLSWHFCFR